MTIGKAAADAMVTIDGIAVTSTTNTVTDALPGVTLNLLALTSAPTQISIDLDKTSMKAKIQAFQDAYNSLYADLKTQTAYDATTKTGGPLLGDNTATSMQGMLRALVGSKGPGASTIDHLSDLGLEIQANGSLKTNSTKLDLALQNPSNVKAFFSTSTGTASSDGIAKRIYDFAFGALAVGGSVSTHNQSFQKAIDQNNKTIDKFNSHIADYQKQLLAQYNALDASMAKLNSLGTFVTQQVAQWNKTG
jgi:flagellar hook-associated protein 2